MRHVRYATFGALANKCTIKLFPNINLCLKHDLMDRLVPKSGTFYFKTHRNLHHYKSISRWKSFVHFVSCPLRSQWVHFLLNRSIKFGEISCVCSWYLNVPDKLNEKCLKPATSSVKCLEVQKTVWMSCPLRWNWPFIDVGQRWRLWTFTVLETQFYKQLCIVHSIK